MCQWKGDWGRRKVIAWSHYPRPRLWLKAIHLSFLIIPLLNTFPYFATILVKQNRLCVRMVTEFSPLGGVVTAVATRLGLDFASTCCDCPRVEEGRSWLCPPGIGMQATTTSPPCLQAPCIGETHFIRREQTEFHLLVFPIQSRRRALAVTKNTGIGRCHRSAAGCRKAPHTPRHRKDNQQNL